MRFLKSLLPLSFAAALLCGCSGDADVVVYTALDREFSEPILEDFTKETGLKVEPKYDIESTKTVGLTQAIIGEANRPRCDVFWNNEILNTLRLQEKGLLEVYHSPAAESYPEDLRYNQEHDWARIDGDEATLGITWFAQDSLGDLVHFEPPEDGAAVTKGSSYGEVESVKAVSDLISPLSGTVIEVNQKVVSEPETVNEDPYGEGWLVRISLGDAWEVADLMDAAAYKALVAEQ